MGEENPCDAGLDLGLGLHGWTPTPSAARWRRKDLSRCTEAEPPATYATSAAAEPSLTLTLSEDACRQSTAGGEEKEALRQSSPTSWSSKREKEGGSEEEEEGNGKKKLRLNKEQSALLEAMFKEHNTLNPTQKQTLASKLNLRPRQVEVWFQNRRARTKLKQTEVDCEHLRKYCERLADENRRLQKELHQLRALKSYVKLPAATTLTMCPSCERKGSGEMAKGGGGAAFVVRPKPHFCSPFATAHPPSAAC
ncbi:unnamed protein product [Spirodela intermedia]|uniref:Homeobox domain-containing protein n=1 Tax=Spirodela intermedia TaxID=51605 RepID=A0A7I8JVP6_SPIIN|nr:unnamed protein product [Spirodela intermedia]